MEDPHVDSLIKELSDLINQCGSDDQSIQIGSSEQGNDENNGNEQKQEKYQNKRKQEVPKKKKKELADIGAIESQSKTKRKISYDQYHNDLSLPPLTIVEAKKRKRKQNSEEKDEEICSEVMDFIVKSSIDEHLQKVALKEKLTQTHVKNIIKQVIKDKSVQAMLRNTVYGFDPSDPRSSAPVYEPKLTRGKVRELYGEKQCGHEVEGQPDGKTANAGEAPCSSAFETKCLVFGDFSDEEEDEEYRPDEQMDDEESLANTSSVLTTPSRSPWPNCSVSNSSFAATPSSSLAASCRSRPSSLLKAGTHPEPLHSAQRCLDFESGESSSIYNRTRSKLPMTDTPLEVIEMAFEPPDITPDMYETEVDDDDWKKFLLDLVQPPLDEAKGGEEDEQMDPEYNILADADEEPPSFEEMKEELRGDKGVRVTKKELNQLMTEFEKSFENDEEEEEKAELHEDTLVSQPEPDLDHFSFPNVECEWSMEQLETLKCQLMQHIQLLTQSILMTFYEEKFQNIEIGSANMLNEIYVESVRCPHSSVVSRPLIEASLETAQLYDVKREEGIQFKNMRSEKGMSRWGMTRLSEKKVLAQMPSFVADLLLESRALPYPDLLPHTPFHVKEAQKRKGYLLSEYYLLAARFSEAVPNPKALFEVKGKKRNVFDSKLKETCLKVALTGCVTTSGTALNNHVRRMLLLNQSEGLYADNPLIKLSKYGRFWLPRAKAENPPVDGLTQVKFMNQRILPPLFRTILQRYSSEKERCMKKTLAMVSKGKKKGKVIVIRGGSSNAAKRIVVQRVTSPSE